MNTKVSSQSPCLIKTLRTLHTFIQLFSSVSSAVYGQLSWWNKTFWTIFTFIWFFPSVSCMLPLMLKKIFRFCESAGTQFAFEWLFIFLSILNRSCFRFQLRLSLTTFLIPFHISRCRWVADVEAVFHFHYSLFFLSMAVKVGRGRESGGYQIAIQTCAWVSIYQFWCPTQWYPQFFCKVPAYPCPMTPYSSSPSSIGLTWARTMG